MVYASVALKDSLENLVVGVIKFQNYTWTTNLTSKINLPSQFALQVSFNYVGPEKNAQSSTKSLYYLNTGIKKNVFKDKATISLDASNILDTRKRITQTKGENYDLTQLTNFHAARYRLVFIYRFNKKPEQRERSQREGNRD